MYHRDDDLHQVSKALRANSVQESEGEVLWKKLR
jgi:hypothetical protein